MPTFVVRCPKESESCATLVDVALAGSVNVEIAHGGGDVLQELLEGRCDGVVLPLAEARVEADHRDLCCQVIARGERRDVLLSSGKSSVTLAKLAPGATVGVVGARRRALLRAFKPSVECVLMGDNLEAAMDALAAGDVSTVIAGGAEVISAGCEGRIDEWLEQTSWVPEAGGAGVGLVLRRERGPLLVSPDVAGAVAAEEAMVAGLVGTKVGVTGALALPYGPYMRLWGLLVSYDGTRAVRADLTGTVAAASDLGQRVADALIERGAGLTGEGSGS
jgi:hydroxymethylbilane synthase